MVLLSRLKKLKVLYVFAAVVVLCGCGRRISTVSEVEQFTYAGWKPEVDTTRLVEARAPERPYRVGPGDVVNVRLVNVLQLADYTEGETAEETIACRVSNQGEICLPMVGTIKVADKTSNQIESEISKAYYPKYVRSNPNVHVTVEDFSTYTVTVLGAVENPGVYELHRDEMTLVAALMKAGGITEDGAEEIKIRHYPQDSSPQAVRKRPPEETVTLPMKGNNIPFSDVKLQPKDVVEVNRQIPQYFTVLGLVNNPGMYPYPPGETYNVNMAIAAAGGPTGTAPNQVTIYRKGPDGKETNVTIKMEPESSKTLEIQPGDTVAVEHTFGSRIASFFSNFFDSGFFMGANYNMAP